MLQSPTPRGSFPSYSLWLTALCQAGGNNPQTLYKCLGGPIHVKEDRRFSFFELPEYVFSSIQQLGGCLLKFEIALTQRIQQQHDRNSQQKD